METIKLEKNQGHFIPGARIGHCVCIIVFESFKLLEIGILEVGKKQENCLLMKKYAYARKNVMHN